MRWQVANVQEKRHGKRHRVRWRATIVYESDVGYFSCNGETLELSSQGAAILTDQNIVKARQEMVVRLALRNYVKGSSQKWSRSDAA